MTPNAVRMKARKLGLPPKPLYWHPPKPDRPKPEKPPQLDKWPPEKAEKLRALWETGMSTARIGREIKMSKNAVVSKAHRLGLSRETPIKPRDPNAPPPAPKSRALKSQAEAARIAATGFAAPPIPAPVVLVRVPRAPAAPDPLPEAPARVLARMRMPIPNLGQCRWIHGDVGTPAARWCAEVASVGPWCADHHAVVYVGVGRRL